MLYEHFWPRFRRHFVLEGQTEGEAEELADQAAINVVRGILDVECEGALISWIWTVARNTLLTHVQKTQAGKQVEIVKNDETWAILSDTVADPDEIDPVTRLCLERQVERFEREHPKRAICLELAIVEGLDMESLTQALGRSYPATAQYLSQCRSKLWEMLKPCFE